MRILGAVEVLLGKIAWISVLAAGTLRCGSDSAEADYERSHYDARPSSVDGYVAGDSAGPDAPSNLSTNPLCGTGEGECYPATDKICLMHPPNGSGSWARDGAAPSVGAGGASTSASSGDALPPAEAGVGIDAGSSTKATGGSPNHAGGSLSGEGGALHAGASGGANGEGGSHRDASVQDGAFGNGGHRDAGLFLFDSSWRADGAAAHDASGQGEGAAPSPGDAASASGWDDSPSPEDGPEQPVDTDGAEPWFEAGTYPDPTAQTGGSREIGDETDASSSGAGGEGGAGGAGGAQGEAPDAQSMTCYVRVASSTVTRRCEPAGSKDEDTKCDDSRECQPGLGCVVAPTAQGEPVAACRLLQCTPLASCSDDRFYDELHLRQDGVTLPVLVPVCRHGDNCTLLAPSCWGGNVCTLIGNGVTTCRPPGNAKIDEDCSVDGRCAEDLVCAKITSRCMRLCHTGASECGTGKCQAGTGSLPSGFGVCIGGY